MNNQNTATGTHSDSEAFSSRVSASYGDETLARLVAKSLFAYGRGVHIRRVWASTEGGAVTVRTDGEGLVQSQIKGVEALGFAVGAVYADLETERGEPGLAIQFWKGNA